MRVKDIVSRATTAHPHSPKGHLPKAAISVKVMMSGVMGS